jgi:hypothetical protein
LWHTGAIQARSKACPIITAINILGVYSQPMLTQQLLLQLHNFFGKKNSGDVCANRTPHFFTGFIAIIFKLPEKVKTISSKNYLEDYLFHSMEMVPFFLN